MKNIKKIFIIGLCLLFVSCAFACNGSQLTQIENYSRIVKCYIGEQGTFENADQFNYETNNSSILKIEGNNYIAVAEGSATVTVREKKGSGIATLLFVVFGEKPIDINSLSIQGAPDNNSLYVEEGATLSYTKEPLNSNNYEAIVWSSDNPNILSVDGSGKISANAMGSATITVSALGTNVKNQVTVNVLPRDTLFNLNYSSVVGVCGQEELLKATVRTDYSFNGNVEWFSENEDIVKVNNGNLTFLQEGTANVGIKAIINDINYSATCKVKVLKDNGYEIIRTPEQLQDISNYSGNYMLGNDIDMQQACAKGGYSYNSGMGFIPLFDSYSNAFCGTFDGNGFEIKNLYINRVGESFVAFIRYISAVSGKEGKIINLSLTNVNIKGANYTSVFYANASGSGSVNSGLENCYASGLVTSVGSASALVGNNKGIVKNCVSAITLEAIGKSNIFALNHTLESNDFGIQNCVYVGNATSELAELKTGGFVNNSFAIAESEVATFDFSFLPTEYWKISNGEMPVLKGV